MGRSPRGPRLPRLFWRGEALRPARSACPCLAVGLLVLSVLEAPSAARAWPFSHLAIAHTTMAPLLGYLASLLAMVLVVGGVTRAYRHTIAMLHASEERFRLLFEAARDPILLLDREGRFSDCNDAAVRALGVASRAQVIGQAPADFSPELQPDGQCSSAKAEQIVRAAFAQGSTQFEWTLRRADGSEFTADIALTAIHTRTLEMLMGHLRDVTALKRAEAALTRQLQLEAAVGVACTRLINVDLSYLNEEIDRVLHALGRIAPTSSCSGSGRRP